MKDIINTKVKQLISDFDFERVHSVMKFTKWHWDTEIPSMSKVVLFAHDLCLKCATEAFEKGMNTHCVSSGGFEVRVYIGEDLKDEYDESGIFIELKFILTEWSA